MHAHVPIICAHTGMYDRSCIKIASAQAIPRPLVLQSVFPRHPPPAFAAAGCCWCHGGLLLLLPAAVAILPDHNTDFQHPKLQLRVKQAALGSAKPQHATNILKHSRQCPAWQMSCGVVSALLTH